MPTEPTICDEIDPAVTHHVYVTAAVPAVDWVIDGNPAHTVTKTDTAWNDLYASYPDELIFTVDSNVALIPRHRALSQIVQNSSFDATVLIVSAGLTRYLTPPPPLSEISPIDAPSLSASATAVLAFRLEYMGPDGSYSETHYINTAADGAPFCKTTAPGFETISQVMLRCYDTAAFKAFFINRALPRYDLPGNYKIFIGLLGISVQASVHLDFYSSAQNTTVNESNINTWVPHTHYESTAPHHFTKKWSVKTVKIICETATPKATNIYADHEGIPPFYIYELEIKYKNIGTYTLPEVPDGTMTIEWTGASNTNEPDAITPLNLWQPIIFNGGANVINIDYTDVGGQTPPAQAYENYHIVWPTLDFVP